jgi:modulator of FtsH protease HflK
VRKKTPPSEIDQFVAPISRLLDGAWRRMHWWVATMAILYALSGITIVKSDEVAVILRWGRLVGQTPALQQHGPGLLFAFPKPVDRVVRIPVKRVWEVPVTTLAAGPSPTGGSPFPQTESAVQDESVGQNQAPEDDESPFIPQISNSMDTLDPLTQGYALTGDNNIVQVEMVARYRVRDPAEWAFYGPKAEDVLRVEVSAAMVRSLGEMGVDRVLSDGRKDLIAMAAGRAQAGLDASRSGLELSSLELTRLAPPMSLAGDFDAVQSAFINAETLKKQAQAYAESVVPQAQADTNTLVQSARGTASNDLATAQGDAAAFLALDREYRANPVVVRERLYRDAVEQAVSHAGKVRWVPPPLNSSYHGMRITIAP